LDIDIALVILYHIPDNGQTVSLFALPQSLFGSFEIIDISFQCS
jgi:hypothetical protein